MVIALGKVLKSSLSRDFDLNVYVWSLMLKISLNFEIQEELNPVVTTLFMKG